MIGHIKGVSTRHRQLDMLLVLAALVTQTDFEKLGAILLTFLVL